MTKLPEKTSALIRVALADLIKCEEDPRYEIDMGFWHRPWPEPLEHGVICSVCLAGSVLAQTVETPINVHMAGLTECVDAVTANKLSALNGIRMGHVVSAVEDIEGPIYEENGPRTDGAMLDRALIVRRIESCHRTLYRPYEDSPSAFKEWLAGIATELERAGF